VSGPPESAWDGLPLGRGVILLARDANGVGALCKPAGVLSHPNATGDEARSLLTAAYRMDEEVYEWPGGRLWLVNRLDSATSGVILVAADASLAAAIRAQFRDRRVRKTYRALVFGKLAARSEVWRDRLSVEKKGGRIRTGGGFTPAESAMSVVRAGPVATQISLEPHTGRSHQLRVQCARRGLPIVGDQTYGDFRRNREFAKATGSKRLFLHSFGTSFDYAFKGRTHHFEATAPLPPEFDANS
jgi:23S rRNA-/tRNA-specific pseudouridylate synthase